MMMTNWPVGLSTGCFWRDSLLSCMERIRASGFSLLEVCSSPPHLDYHNAAAVREAAARAVELGMEIYSFHAPFGREIDISSLNAASRESSVEEILVAVDAAAILGVHYFVIHPGPEDVANASVEERITAATRTFFA